MKILDCTLRDGGYYTNWDFDKTLLDVYFDSFNYLPVDYLEIGYRSNPMNSYLGAYFYCPVQILKGIKEKSQKKLVIMINEKDVRAEDCDVLLTPCIGLVDMVRLAIDPSNFERALKLAQKVKSLGFELGMNVMYMSNWKYQSKFIKQLKEVNGLADYFYMVDSYGSVFPKDVKETYKLVEAEVTTNIGFHGHNNMEMALMNTLTAIDCGAQIVDSTITGMGRGAGNLKTELLLSTLNVRNKLPIDFNPLSQIVDSFTELQSSYKWGTSLPYMVSGGNSLPQKDVMEWMTKKTFCFNSIIRALNNQKEGIEDNEKLAQFIPKKKFNKALIIGGGPSAITHKEASIVFVKNNKDDIWIIHASSKNAKVYQNLVDIDQFFCLVGSEGYRLANILSNIVNFKGLCILPPFPRKLGTYIPSKVKQSCYELSSSDINFPLNDTHTILALQIAKNLNVKDLFIIGYDGYTNTNISSKEHELFIQNQQIFNAIKDDFNAVSIVPTTYNLDSKSVYSYLIK